jgi:hypothetical protein
MLTAVPTSVNTSARIVTLRHPNSQEATLSRKTLNRTDSGTVNDLPTIDGLGVLDSEDESDFTYNELGPCKVMFTGAYQGEEGNWNRADTGLTYPALSEACIECTLDPTDANFFTPDIHDLVFVTPGGGFVLAYEIEAVTGAINIAPFTRKYVMKPRADLMFGI